MKRESLIYTKIMNEVHITEQKKSFIKLIKDFLELPFDVFTFVLPTSYRFAAITAVILGILIGTNYYNNINYTNTNIDAYYYPIYSIN